MCRSLARGKDLSRWGTSFLLYEACARSLTGAGIVFLRESGILEGINAINRFLILRYVKTLFIDN